MKKTINASLILLIVFVLISLNSCASQVNKVLAEYLKREKFNLEIYELAFCIDEIVDILESDSSNLIILKKRINQAFDKSLNEDQKAIHNKEIAFFNKSLQTKILLKEKYPDTFKSLTSILKERNTESIKNYAITFRNYVEYPEQVDDICLITLIMPYSSKAWKAIQSDKIALLRFNNWIEYGFEEFRFYPGLKSEPKRILNARIVKYVKESNVENTDPLVIRSIEMIDRVITKYKNK